MKVIPQYKVIGLDNPVTMTGLSLDLVLDNHDQSLDEGVENDPKALWDKVLYLIDKLNRPYGMACRLWSALLP